MHGVKTDLFSEADDQSLLQAFDAGVAQWKDHDDVKYLPCDAVRDRLMSARMGGTHLTEEVKKLRCPLQLQPWVSKLDELNATIRQVVHEAKGYLAQFQQLADNEKEKTEADKRAWRNHRDRMAARIKQGSCGEIAMPPLLARIIANAIKSGEDDAPKAHADQVGDEEANVDTPDGSAGCASLKKTYKLFAKDAESGSHWDRALSSFFDAAMTENCMTKANLILDDLKEQGSFHGFSTVSPPSEFPWNSPGQPMIQNVPELRVVIHVQVCHKFDVGFSAWPWKGVPMMLKMLMGCAVVTVLPPEIVQSAGSNVLSCFDESKTKGKEFTKAKSFIVKEKDSVWVPFGAMAIVYAVELDESGDFSLKKPVPNLTCLD